VKARTTKMPALPQFDYIFAIATLFAFLDAWNIGTLQSLQVTPFYPSTGYSSHASSLSWEIKPIDIY
jgi:hypothetical protein